MKKRNLVLFSTTAMLSLALAGTIGAVTASAATITSEQTGDKTVELSYTVAEKWTVTIPDTIDITEGTGTGTVTASDLVLNEGESLKVTVESTNSWKLQTAGGKSIEYDVKVKGASIKESGTVLEGITGESEELSAELSVELTNAEDAKTAGTYTDTLTFHVDVE